jgi:hypothetical protein
MSKTRKNFPGRKDARRIDHLTRQEDSDSLTPMQKLAKLDKRLGEGKGAVSERFKLQSLIDNPPVEKKLKKSKKKIN